MAKKKPDQVADNPNILPYASNVGAPVIKPTDLTSFKQEKILKTNDYFKSRYEEIKKEYQELIHILLSSFRYKQQFDLQNTNTHLHINLMFYIVLLPRVVTAFDHEVV